MLYNMGHIIQIKTYAELSVFPVSQSLYFCEKLLDEVRCGVLNIDSTVDIATTLFLIQL